MKDFTSFIEEVNRWLTATSGAPLTPEERIFLEASWDKITIKEAIAREEERSGQAYSYRQVTNPLNLINFLRQTFDLEESESISKYNICEILSRYDLVALSKAEKGERFYGRKKEISDLKELIKTKHLIVVYGAAGIGKSSLVRQVAQSIGWKTISLSLYTNPSQQDSLSILSQKMGAASPFEAKGKNLIIMESAEALLRNTHSRSLLENDHTREWCDFFWKWIEYPHQNCLILVSQRPFLDLQEFEDAQMSVIQYKLDGLDFEAASQILQEYHLKDKNLWGELIRIHRANPQALHEIGELIASLHEGKISEWMLLQTVILPEPQIAYLNEIFTELTELQMEILKVLCQIEHDHTVSYPQFRNQLREKGASFSSIDQSFMDLKKRDLVSLEQGNVNLPLTIRKYIKQSRPCHSASTPLALG